MEFETSEKHLHGCVGGPWLCGPSSQEREWVGNGDLEVVSVDTGIEDIGTDRASWEGTRLGKNRGQGQALENGELGAEEPKEAWIGEPTFFPQHPVPSFWPRSSLFLTAQPTGHLLLQALTSFTSCLLAA